MNLQRMDCCGGRGVHEGTPQSCYELRVQKSSCSQDERKRKCGIFVLSPAVVEVEVGDRVVERQGTAEEEELPANEGVSGLAPFKPNTKRPHQ